MNAACLLLEKFEVYVLEVDEMRSFIASSSFPSPMICKADSFLSIPDALSVSFKFLQTSLSCPARTILIKKLVFLIKN